VFFVSTRQITDAQANRAQFLAESGVQDAILKIARNSNASSSYTLTEADGAVNISITANSATSSTIFATSTVTQAGNNVGWTMRADITLDADGKIISISKTNL